MAEDIKGANKAATSLGKQLDEHLRSRGAMNGGDKVEVTLDYCDARKMIDVYRILRDLRKQTKQLIAMGRQIAYCDERIR